MLPSVTFFQKRDNFVHNEFVLINCLYICNPSTEGMETWHFSPKLRLKCFLFFYVVNGI
jgi:hypothetical protein